MKFDALYGPKNDNRICTACLNFTRDCSSNMVHLIDGRASASSNLDSSQTEFGSYFCYCICECRKDMKPIQLTGQRNHRIIVVVQDHSHCITMIILRFRASTRGSSYSSNSWRAPGAGPSEITGGLPFSPARHHVLYSFEAFSHRHLLAGMSGH